MPRDNDEVGLKPSGCCFFLLYPFICVTFSLTVPHGGATLLISQLKKISLAIKLEANQKFSKKRTRKPSSATCWRPAFCRNETK